MYIVCLSRVCLTKYLLESKMLKTNVLYIKKNMYSTASMLFLKVPWFLRLLKEREWMVWNCHTIHTFSIVSYFKFGRLGTWCWNDELWIGENRRMHEHVLLCQGSCNLFCWLSWREINLMSEKLVDSYVKCLQAEPSISRKRWSSDIIQTSPVLLSL